MGLAPEQCRAARGWLDLTQEDLAQRAKVSLSTVRDFEKGRRRPIGNNLTAIEQVFASEGIAFQFNGERPAGLTIQGKPPSES